MQNSIFGDPGRGLPYIGRAMISDAQLEYLDEVLGVSVAPIVVVRTRDLSADDQELLHKILGSVQLSDYALNPSSDEKARHILDFRGQSRPGRVQSGWQCVWHLPQLVEMRQGSELAAELKKTTWALLQQFARERFA